MKDLTLAAVILAGGKARRLNNIAKGNIKIGQHTIIEQLINALNKASINDIIISANDPKPYQQYNLPIITDKHKNIGPLAGIVAALEYLKKHDIVIFLPCDLPNITYTEILTIKNNIDPNNIVYAATKERTHPLCTAIPTNKLTLINNLIENDTKKILTAFNKLNAKPIKFDDENKFYNINSKATLWVITGAGRGVGKTTLANKLTAILPHSTYAKYGHGKFNPNKQKSFFNTLDSIYAFIDQNQYTHQHIIVEANALALAGMGDITIYIDGDPTKTKFRHDADKLKTLADIKLTTITQTST
jgi:molybdopterin-guanine dinucleotide biosynthesis protein A